MVPACPFLDRLKLVEEFHPFDFVSAAFEAVGAVVGRSGGGSGSGVTREAGLVAD